MMQAGNNSTAPKPTIEEEDSTILGIKSEIRYIVCEREMYLTLPRIEHMAQFIDYGREIHSIVNVEWETWFINCRW